jgi:23S rRNA pseudouridine2605 synthase
MKNRRFKPGTYDHKKKPASAKVPDYEFLRNNKNERPKAEGIRLNKYIANAGICSRREADSLIEAGEVSVNGKKITELGFKVNVKDKVSYKGKLLQREKFVYILLNKPKDLITTTKDPEGRKTVMSLFKQVKERIYPVGRLDRNTTGLLLLTNDGGLAERLAHPSYNIRKIYEVELDSPIAEDSVQKIKEGLDLEDGRINVDEIAVLSPDARLLGVEIHSGKNRIVRRIFEHFGHDVIKLDRVMYSFLTKKDLPRGKWRFLKEHEVIKLVHLGNPRKKTQRK